MFKKAHRAKNKSSLFPEYDFSSKEASSKDIQAAKLFWKKRANIQLYSGIDDIIAASNNNVEQFMRVFSPFIDHLIYCVELDKSQKILHREQKQIFNSIVKKYIDDVILRLHYSDKIYRLIENLGNFFKLRTYEPSSFWEKKMLKFFKHLS